MLSSNAICAVTLAFIVGMVWLRTRMHYRRGRERIALTRAGRIYFAVLAGVVVLGWVPAPAAGAAVLPPAPRTPPPSRAGWVFSPHFLFISLPRAVLGRRAEAFNVA